MAKVTDMRWILIFVTTIFVSGASAAQIYKCTDENGRMVFSQTKCDFDAEVVTIEDKKTSSESGGEYTRQHYNELNERMNIAVDRRVLKNSIFSNVQKIGSLRKKMDDEVAETKASMRFSENNTAGAIRDLRLSKEIDTITRKYQNMIRSIERKNSELSRNLAEIENKIGR